MMVLEYYNDFINGGDPYVREYLMLRSIKPMVVIVTCYVLFVTYIGPQIMKPRKALDLRKLIIFYNCILIIYYIYFLLGGLYFLLQLGPKKIFCDSSLDSKKDPLIANFYIHGYLMYCVRFVELIDTVFLVLSKKFRMITPLHVFHHAVVPVFGWFGFRTEKSAYLAAFMCLNSFIHVIMYTYYAIAALGPEYQKYIWWKKYLTFLQIGQFFISIIYIAVMYAIGCTTSYFVGVGTTVLLVIFFFWFIEFYNKTYRTSKAKAVLQNGSHNLSNQLPHEKTN